MCAEMTAGALLVYPPRLVLALAAPGARFSSAPSGLQRRLKHNWRSSRIQGALLKRRMRAAVTAAALWVLLLCPVLALSAAKAHLCHNRSPPMRLSCGR